MVAADLMVVITEVILWQVSGYYFPGSFLKITVVCSVVDILVRSAINCSVWFTVAFTFDRFIAICCGKLKRTYCTAMTAAAVLAIIGTIFSLKNIPFYFAYEFGELINNVPWFCKVKPDYYTEPVWVGYDWFNTVLTPLLPFSLVLLFNALTIKYILVANRIRRGMSGQNRGENGNDSELQSRRKSIMLLFTISGSFILFWLVYVIEFLHYAVTETGRLGYNDSLLMIEQVGYMLLNLSCCTNSFIYGVAQSKFREQFMITVKSPLALIIRVIYKRKNAQWIVQ